jgi:hypothetical protein
MGIFDKTPIADFFKRAKALTEDDLFLAVITQQGVKKFIVKLNTDQMRLEFVNSEGVLLSDIGGGYSDQTLAEGKKKGKFKVDLYDTGDFHKSFRVENVTGKGFTITSDPIKEDGTNLLDEWGAEVEGLTFESLGKLSLFLVSRYQSEIRKKLNL